MKNRGVTAIVLLTFLFFATGIVAQHPPDHGTPGARKQDPRASDNMMKHHQEMEKLAEEALESLAALELEGEQGSEAMKKRLAEHRALLELMQVKIRQCSETTQKPGRQTRGCCGAGSAHKH